MSYDNQQHPQQGNRPSQAGARPHDPLDGVGNVVQRQTSPRNLQQGKPSTDVASLDKVVKDLKDSLGPVGGSISGFPPSSAAPSPSVRNVIQRQTSPKNLQQGKPSADGTSLDKGRKAIQGQTSPRNLQQGKPFTDVPSLETVENVVQRQTSPENPQQVKPSTDVPSLDKVVKELKESSGRVGGSVPGFPHSPTAPSPSARNVIQRQTSPRNLQQGKPSTHVPSLDKVLLDCVCPTPGNDVQRQTSPGNLQQGKPSTDVTSFDNVVKDLKDSSGPVGGSVPGFPPSSADTSPSVGNVIQRQTSPRNLQQGKPSTHVPSLDKVGNDVQCQTSPGNLQQGKPSKHVPSFDNIIKDLKDYSGPVGGSVPNFPPSSAASSPSENGTNCIRKCLAALSPCCIG